MQKVSAVLNALERISQVPLGHLTPYNVTTCPKHQCMLNELYLFFCEIIVEMKVAFCAQDLYLIPLNLFIKHVKRKGQRAALYTNHLTQEEVLIFHAMTQDVQIFYRV